MKKLFVALMAIFVLASCAEKSPADAIVKTAELMSATAEKMEAVNNCDEFIDVLENFANDIKVLQEEYAEDFAQLDELGESELAEMYPEASEALQAAAMKYSEVVIQKMEIVQEMTPEQEERLMAIFSNLEL